MTKINQSNKDEIVCSITGLIGGDFIQKKVSNKTIYQGKLFLNDSNKKYDIINKLKEDNHLITDRVKCSNSVVVNIWNLDLYEQFKYLLKKGSTVEIHGILKYKIYNRFCGGERLQLFFVINKVFRIREPIYEFNEEKHNENILPQIVYTQF